MVKVIGFTKLDWKNMLASKSQTKRKYVTSKSDCISGLETRQAATAISNLKLGAISLTSIWDEITDSFGVGKYQKELTHKKWSKKSLMIP